MARRKLTPDEERAYRELAQAARHLREAQKRAAERPEVAANTTLPEVLRIVAQYLEDRRMSSIELPSKAPLWELLRHAADEIERLRKENAKLRQIAAGGDDGL